MGGFAAPPTPPLLPFFEGIEMPSYLNHHFLTPSTPSYFVDYVTHNLLVMLGMLAGHAGVVENDAGLAG